MSQKGKITQIIGAVVDVNFESDLPEIYTALDEESYVQIKNKQFQRPGAKHEENMHQKNMFKFVLLIFLFFEEIFMGLKLFLD